MTDLERYGPQADLIVKMVGMCDTLTPDQLMDMAEAHRKLGINRGAWEAWAAAKAAGRESKSGAAAYAVELAMKMNLLFIDDEETRRACGWVANDAGLAISTRDLVGTGSYSQFDFDKLISAWRVGAEDPA